MVNNKRHTESFKIVKSTNDKLVVDFSRWYLELLFSTNGIVIIGIILLILSYIFTPLMIFYMSIPFALLVFCYYIFKKHLLKRLKITQDKVIFEYYLEGDNHIFKPSKNVRILVHTNNKKLEMELFDTRIPLKSAEDFPILLDNITKVLQLQLEESVELKPGKDLLKYKTVKNRLNKTN